jgi:protein O-GlcNAc transferase
VADEVSARIQAQCHVWRQVHALDDEALARQIREDRIDILIDLAGHTDKNRVPAFAWKPAPVQATWLGYLGTTGVAAIDYLIADDWTLPPEFEPHFTENIWRLPRSYLCFTPPAEDCAIGPLPALANGYVTFGSFNNLIKVGPDVVSLWSRVLHAVPQSRLLLKTTQFIEASVRQDVAQQFARHGITSSRLMLEPPVPRADYLKPYNRVDIALDPFPYPGITTSVECLWMGVPFVTLAGKTFMARQGIGLLNNAGLPDWIAADEDDYVKLAARRAGDLHSLQQLRQELRARVFASPIFDAQSFAQNFESAMRGMWRAWCARQGQ